MVRCLTEKEMKKGCLKTFKYDNVITQGQSAGGWGRLAKRVEKRSGGNRAGDAGKNTVLFLFQKPRSVQNKNSTGGWSFQLLRLLYLHPGHRALTLLDHLKCSFLHSRNR